MALVPSPKNCDPSVKKAIQLLSSKLDYDSRRTFENITLTDLTASSLIGTNASKLLESVTIGTGLDYTRPTLSLSHLGIEVLTDPGVDKIMFWDNSATACNWLGMGNSVAITDVTLDTIQDIRTTAWPQFVHTNTALSSQILTGGVISAGTNAGTIKVAALTALLRTGAGATDPLVKITLAEQDNITLAAVDTFYNVRLTYGSPCTIATSTSSGNGANIIGIGHCLKETDGTRHYANAGLRLSDGVRKLHNRASTLRRIEKGSGGALVSDPSTRNLYITAGTFHRGVNSYSFAAKDTSAAPTPDTFDYYYYNPTTSAWVKDDNTGNHYTQIDNVQYNNVAAGTGLANLTTNKYTTNWVFVHPDDEHILVVYGQINGTLTAAQNESIPASLPDIIDKMAVFLCKVIIQEGSDTLIFENVEYFTFTPDITVDHNELQGLQGGTANEYYHLTSAEHTLISAVGGLIPTDSNFIVGNGTTWVAESGATARTSLGLGTGDNPTFNSLYINGPNADDVHIHSSSGDGPSKIKISWADVTEQGEFIFYEGATFMGSFGVFGSNYADVSWRNALLFSATNNNLGKMVFRTKTNNAYKNRMIVSNAGLVGIPIITNSMLTADGSLSLKEQASANADTAAYGQIWVKNDAPNTLWFTRDDGTDVQIA